MAAKELSQTILIHDANLQGYWKLENANDSGPHGYNLSNVGSPTYVAAQFNNGLSATGSAYLDIAVGSVPSLNITSDLTIFAWVNQQNGAQGVVSNYDNTNGYLLYVNWGASPVHASFYCPNLTGGNVISTDVISPSTWYFLCGRWNHTTGELSVWVNGNKTAVTGVTGNIVANTGFFGIGGTFTPGTQIIDDVAIFNRALSDGEITGYYAGTLAGLGNGGFFMAA